MGDVKIQLLKGTEVLHYIDAIPKFRSTIYREYPYLYESDPQFEEKYVRFYAKSAHSLFIIATDGEKVIGCLTAIPAAEVLSEHWAAPLRTLPAESYLYLGDILLLKEYRNRKIGTKMYDLFEKEVLKEKKFSKIAFQEVVRSKDDPKRPKDYQSNDHFWKKRGYIKHPELVNNIPYEEVGEEWETPHIYVFWIKEL